MSLVHVLDFRQSFCKFILSRLKSNPAASINPRSPVNEKFTKRVFFKVILMHGRNILGMICPSMFSREQESCPINQQEGCRDDKTRKLRQDLNTLVLDEHFSNKNFARSDSCDT